jgi:hypothetical protein
MAIGRNRRIWTENLSNEDVSESAVADNNPPPFTNLFPRKTGGFSLSPFKMSHQV